MVLLHGIGRSAGVWQHLIDLLPPEKYRVLAYDLLGFGQSPKPNWPKYDVQTHAQAVIASLKRAKLAEPVILVGHSLGCLVAVEVARRRPGLVKRLVLYEMPLYDGLPEKRRHRLRLNVYFALYKRIVEYQPEAAGKYSRGAQRLAEKITGYKVGSDSWPAFVKSLENTIMQQTAADDIKRLKMPIDVIYGTRDQLVIRGKVKEIFGEDVEHVAAHTIRESHRITAKAARFLAERIAAVNSQKDANRG